MDNHTKDIIGNANMYNGYNVQFVEDRFGKANSAIRFSDGYYQVPPGVYFNGDFSVSVWVKINVQTDSSRIIDFNNDECSINNVIVGASDSGNNLPFFQHIVSIFNSKVDSNLALINGQWTHLVVTLNEITGSIYINGLLVGQAFDVYVPRYANRTLNYIGKSCSADDGNLQADLDDLRIYNRALSQSEVYDLIRLTSGYTPYLTTTTTTTTTTLTKTSISTTTASTATTTKPSTTTSKLTTVITTTSTTKPTSTTPKPSTATTATTKLAAVLNSTYLTTTTTTKASTSSTKPHTFG